MGWRGFLRRWGVSMVSLGSGFATLAVFRRGVPHVGWIVGYVLVLVLLSVTLAQTRAALVAHGRRRVVHVGDYTVQTLAHGLLLFVLPGYWACAPLDGPSAPFVGLLAMAALVTAVDPWYRVIVVPRPWLERAIFRLSLFAGLNVALPLVGVPPAWASPTSAAFATLVPVPLARATGWRMALGRAGVIAAAGAGVGALLLPVIPPAPLSLVRPTMARAVMELEPVEPVSHLSEVELRAWGGLVAYTPVAAPAGLHQPIRHRWRHAGGHVATVALTTPIQGGRTAGFRTFSRKTDFPPDARGRWVVDVLTGAGQLVGRLRFTIDP